MARVFAQYLTICNNGNLYPIALNISLVRSKFFRTLKKSSKMPKVIANCAKVAKNFEIWSHWAE